MQKLEVGTISAQLWPERISPVEIVTNNDKGIKVHPSIIIEEKEDFAEALQESEIPPTGFALQLGEAGKDGTVEQSSYDVSSESKSV